MTGPEKEGGIPVIPTGEQALEKDRQEGVPSEDARSARPDAAPTEGGKATAREEEIAGRALDTITDGDGNYLEPPD